MINDFRLTILSVIAMNEGKYSWYQIDRQLSIRGITMPENLMQAIGFLECEGLIVAKKGGNVSQPVYSLTPKGIEYINERAEHKPDVI